MHALENKTWLLKIGKMPLLVIFLKLDSLTSYVTSHDGNDDECSLPSLMRMRMMMVVMTMVVMLVSYHLLWKKIRTMIPSTIPSPTTSPSPHPLTSPLPASRPSCCVWQSLAPGPLALLPRKALPSNLCGFLPHRSSAFPCPPM